MLTTKRVKLGLQSKRAGWWQGVLVIGLLALALAACQPTTQPAPTPGGFGGGPRSNFQMTPASELPTSQPVVRGSVVSRNGGLLMVQEGNQGFGFDPGNGTPRAGNGTPRPTFEGTPRPRPTPGGGIEVQVDVSGAKIYQDVTFADLNGQPPNGTIQQKVETSSLDSLPDNSRVTIWGEQNGDQITASVVVYSQVRSFQPQ